MSHSLLGTVQRPPAPRHRRLLPTAARVLAVGSLLVLLPVLVAALASGCGGDAAGGVPTAPATGSWTDPGLSPEPVPSEHASPSAGTSPGGRSVIPTVYFLGGSGARECVVSNADWSAELSKLARAEIRAIDLGATNQSYLADRRYVCNMPDGPTMVVIGVGLGRYTTPPPAGIDCDKKLSPPLQQALDGELEVEHRYSEARVQPVERKEQLLTTWLAERYPLFRKNYAANRDELEALLRECRERGFSAVLLELPLNLEIIGHDLDAARETYTKDCRVLAGRYHAPWISFVHELALPNTSFYDLMHLVEPGRNLWQTRLSQEVAPLLAGG